MGTVSTLDFSSILNAGRQSGPAVGNLGALGGASTANPFMPAPGGLNFGQGGLLGSSSQMDMTNLLLQVMADKKALDQYPNLKNNPSNLSFKEQAEKIRDARETVSTRDAAEQISNVAEDGH